MRSYWFTDPITLNACLLVISETGMPGVIHVQEDRSTCEWTAEVTIHLDAFYCTACGSNGRVSGGWVLEMIGKELHRPVGIARVVPYVLKQQTDHLDYRR